MRWFRISIVRNSSKIILTDYKENQSGMYNSAASTYEETIAMSLNGLSTLSFSIAGYVHDIHNGSMQENRYISLLRNGAVLLYEEADKTIKFIVTSITPTITKNNIIYEISCTEQIALIWGKRGVGYSYDTGGYPQTVQTIAETILKENYIFDWKVKNTFPALTNYAVVPVTFSITDSNLYQALTQLCESFNLFFTADYANQTITFTDKENIDFSGYRLNLATNVNSISLSSESEQLCNILRVRGGENEYGEMISMIPEIPTPFQLYFLANQDEWMTAPDFSTTYYSDVYKKIKATPDYDALMENEDIVKECDIFVAIADAVPHLSEFFIDNTYFTDNNLLNSNDIHDLYSLIYVSMRKNNLWLKLYLNTYYRYEWESSKILNSLETTAQQWIAEQIYLQTLRQEGKSETDEDVVRQKNLLLNTEQTLTSNIKNSNYNLFNKKYYIYGRNRLINYGNITQNVLDTGIDYKLTDGTNEIYLEERIENFEDLTEEEKYTTFYDNLPEDYNDNGYKEQFWIDSYRVAAIKYKNKAGTTSDEFKAVANQLNLIYLYDEDGNINPTYITSVTSLMQQFALLKSNEILYRNSGIDWDYYTETEEVVNSLTETAYSIKLMNNFTKNSNTRIMRNGLLIEERKNRNGTSDSYNNYTLTTSNNVTTLTVSSSADPFQPEENIVVYQEDSKITPPLFGWNYLVYYSLAAALVNWGLERNDNTKYSLYKTIYDKTENNKDIWELIYKMYGDYMYEEYYYDSYQLDSTSLYEQAIIKFNSIKTPAVSYSFSVLDLFALEGIVATIPLPGQYLLFNNEALESQSPTFFNNRQLFIESLQKNPRSAADQTVTIEVRRPQEEIIKQLLLSLKV